MCVGYKYLRGDKIRKCATVSQECSFDIKMFVVDSWRKKIGKIRKNIEGTDPKLNMACQKNVIINSTLFKGSYRLNF